MAGNKKLSESEIRYITEDVESEILGVDVSEVARNYNKIIDDVAETIITNINKMKIDVDNAYNGRAMLVINNFKIANLKIDAMISKLRKASDILKQSLRQMDR